MRANVRSSLLGNCSLGIRGVLGVCHAGLLCACGGTTVPGQAVVAVSDAGPVAEASARGGTSLDAGKSEAADAGAFEAGLDAGKSEAADTGTFEAGLDAPKEAPDAALCAGLADAALAQYQAVVEQNQSCNQDTDCVWSGGSLLGSCVSPCGTVTDQAGVGRVQAAATQACQAYNAQGCPAILLGCPAAPPLLCSVGACYSYSFGVTPRATLTHGVCQTFELGYYLNGNAPPPGAPHDLVVPLSGASNGTLYADATCTTPLTSQTLTIPAGSSQVAFSFLPTTAGTCGFTVDNVYYGCSVQ
jgi:hypothetical protein